MGQIFLTAKTINGDSPVTPRVVAVNSERIKMHPGKKNGLTKVVEYIGDQIINTFLVYESPAEINAQILVNEGQGTTLLAKNFVDLGLDAAGANAGASTDVTKYFTEFDTSVATSADGVQLDAAVVGKVRVVVNTSLVALEVWPQSGENFKGSADDAAIVHAGRTRVHYVCVTATEWVKAEDYTQV